jgi:hypothetical protein
MWFSSLSVGTTETTVEGAAIVNSPYLSFVKMTPDFYSASVLGDLNLEGV